MNPPTDPAGIAAQSPWTDIPLHVLHAELRRRQEDGERPACGSKGNMGDYDVSAHVFAVALILGLSTLACSFPILARQFPRLPIPHHFLFLSRHFGTGVLIATAFVHLLPTAFTSLTDPCLPPFWSVRYRPMAGLVAMASVLVIVGIEMFFATRGAGHVHGSGFDAPPPDRGIEGNDHPDIHVNGDASRSRSNSAQQTVLKRFRGAPIGVDDEELQSLRPAGTRNGWAVVPQKSPGAPDTPMGEYHDDEGRGVRRDDANSDSDLDLDELDDPAAHGGLMSPSGGTTTYQRRKSSASLSHHSHQHNPMVHALPSDPVAAKALEQRLLLQCILLEAGILFHSVFVGMAVSVSTGSAFVVLLVAISFHQTFEGLALGARIAAIPTLSPQHAKPWLMALAYGTTTPIGQVIGLGARNLYDPHGEVGLLMVGIMNAISSGLLLFAGLVELLAEDFLSDASYQTLKGKRRKQAIASVVAGALLMALVGAWA